MAIGVIGDCGELVRKSVTKENISGMIRVSTLYYIFHFLTRSSRLATLTMLSNPGERARVRGERGLTNTLKCFPVMTVPSVKLSKFHSIIEIALSKMPIMNCSCLCTFQETFAFFRTHRIFHLYD